MLARVKALAGVRTVCMACRKKYFATRGSVVVSALANTPLVEIHRTAQSIKALLDLVNLVHTHRRNLSSSNSVLRVNPSTKSAFWTLGCSPIQCLMRSRLSFADNLT